MANQEQLERLKAGVEVWNKWREAKPNTKIDLREADLDGADLRKANLSKANLSVAKLRRANLARANLSEAYLSEAKLVRNSDGRVYLDIANLNGANLSEVNLIEAKLSEVDFSGANLSGASLSGAKLNGANLRKANLIKADLSAASLNKVNLSRANLSGANLSGIDLSGANISGAKLIETDLTNSNLVGVNISNARISKSNVYGVNVWDLEGEFKEQKDLVVTPDGHSPITVDNIKIAQFIYLILNNKEIRDVINSLTSKTVLILGRFAIPERKAILDTLRDKLRKHDLLPIVFDFERPSDKDFTETIKTLAGLCYFVIADVTNPKSSPLELQATVPDYQIPFVPIIQEGESPFAMMANLQTKYNWVLPTVTYDTQDTLVKILKPLIIDPAMKKHNELRILKAQIPQVISGKDYLDREK